MAIQRIDMEPLAVSIERAGELLSISRKKAYEMAKAGEIPTVPMGKKRRVVPVNELKKMLQEKMSIS